MIFTETKLKGAYLIDLEPNEDERGFFARTYCEREFKKLGLTACSAQCNLSYNRKKGTLRGMHYQVEPFSEAKLITCLSGAIYDVIIDLRPDSPTYCQWLGLELAGVRDRGSYAVYSGGFRSRLSDFGGRHRSLLSDVRVLPPRVGSRFTLERSRFWYRLARHRAIHFRKKTATSRTFRCGEDRKTVSGEQSPPADLPRLTACCVPAHWITAHC